jgi:enterochelin esterase-like enzyme
VIQGGRWSNGPRPSLIYLPPHIDPHRRYPVVYLLHGIRGAPYSFPGGLKFTAVADHLIASHRTRPFIAVMPPAGVNPSFRGEWTGSWETYVVRSVVNYADRTLPTVPRPEDRSIAGLSAGGYGAVDIALRHPGVFGTVEAWSGYFTAPHDGSLAHAGAPALEAHDPSVLARDQARSPRTAAVRFYLTAGARDREALTPTRRFARELTRLGLRPTLVITPGGHTTSSWRAGLPGALSFAVGSPQAIAPPRRAPAH